MTTRLRLDPADGLHHITSHRVEHGNLYENDQDRWLFLRLLTSASTKFEVDVVSYCLMGNHYHLVLHCPKRGVSHFMHHVNGTYAQCYNRRHGRIGPLFNDNFHNVLITSDGQLIFTTRYIDRNPLELGINIRNYPWSSYSAYLQPDRPVSIVPLNARLPLGIVGGPASYRQFVETDNATDKFGMKWGTATIAPSPHVWPKQAMTDLLALATRLAAKTPGSASSRARTARRSSVLLAHELDLGLGNEIREFFGFASLHAHRSFLTRARNHSQSEPSFYAHVRAAWQLHNMTLSQAS